MGHKFFANDPSFGRQKTFSGKDDPVKKGIKLDSHHTMEPKRYRSAEDDPYKGTSPLVPQADYYSNPNPDEHVHSFPSKLREMAERGTEEYALWAIGIGLFGLAILRVST